MLGLNTTGRPDKTDFLLGRACVFVSELDSTTGLPTCYRPLGNTPALSVSIDIEELTHRSSLCSKFGGAVIDRRLIIQQALNLSMTLEELNHENVAIFFSANTDNPANPLVAGVTITTFTTALALNCWYAFEDGGVRMLGGSVAPVITLDPAGAATVLTAGDSPTGDYTVDRDCGLIELHGSGPNSLVGGETIAWTFAADAGAPATIERVLALEASQRTFAVKALIENANNNNEIVEMEFHSVNLVGDGELSPVSDELAQMTLAGVAESNSKISGSPTLTISKAVG